MERAKSLVGDHGSRVNSPDRASEYDALIPEAISPLASTLSSVRVVLPQVSSSSPHKPNLLRTPSKTGSFRTLDHDGVHLSHTPTMASESIKVIIRIRPTHNPVDSGEKGMKWTPRAINVVWDNSEKSLKHAIAAQLKKKEFFFDRVYDPESKQKDIYEDHCHTMVTKCMSGFNATIFAYGQTSSGKTHTMMGPPSGGAPIALEDEGVIPRCGLSVFAHVAACHSQQPRTQQFNVLVSYLEIYNEKVYDLLGDRATNVLKDKISLEINEHPVSGFFVAGLSKHTVNSGEEVQALIREGSKNRCVSSTKMNDLSSRSHSVLTFWIHKSSLEHDLPTTAISSQLNLVDLAGSEKYDINLTPQSKMQQGKETTNINQSLSCLANVISALSAGADVTQTPELRSPPRHVPYRDSKLTLLLKSSLGGNASTLMIACLNPAFTNLVESVSTLRYAHRAKLVKNRPTLNTDPKDALIHRIRLISAELAEVQEQLRLQNSLPGRLMKLVRKTYVKVRESTRSLGFDLNEYMWTREAGEIEEEDKSERNRDVRDEKEGKEQTTALENRKSKLKQEGKEEFNDESHRSKSSRELKRGVSQETIEEGKGEEEDEGSDDEEAEEEIIEGDEEEFKTVKWDTERLIRLHDLLKSSQDRSLVRQTSRGVATVPLAIESSSAPCINDSSSASAASSCLVLSPAASSSVPCSSSAPSFLFSPASAAAAIALLSAPTPVASSSSFALLSSSTASISSTNTSASSLGSGGNVMSNDVASSSTPSSDDTTIVTTTTITISTATTPQPSVSVLSPAPFTMSVGSWGEIEKPVAEFLQIAHNELNSISQTISELESQPLLAVSPTLQEELRTEEKKYAALCDQVKEAQTEVDRMGTGMGVAGSPKENADADYRAFYEIATLRSDRMLSLRVAKQRMAQQKDRIDLLQAELKSKQIIEENEQVARTSHARLIQRQQALLRMEEQLWNTVAARKPDSSATFIISPAGSSSCSTSTSALRRSLSPSPRSPLSFTLSLPSPYPVSSLTLPAHLSHSAVLPNTSASSSSSSSSSAVLLTSTVPLAAETPHAASANNEDQSKTKLASVEEENNTLKTKLEELTATLEDLRLSKRDSTSSSSVAAASIAIPASTALSINTSLSIPSTAVLSSSAPSTPAFSIPPFASPSGASATPSTRETREGSRRHGLEAISSKFRPEKETKNLVRLAELQESLARVASSAAPPKTPTIPPPPPRRKRPPPPPPESLLSPSTPVSLLPALLYSAILRMSLASEYRQFEAERYAHFWEEAKQRNIERDTEIHDLQEDLRHTRQAKTELAIYSAAALAETKDMLTKLEEQVEYLTQKQQEASRPRSSMSLSRSRR